MHIVEEPTTRTKAPFTLPGFGNRLRELRRLANLTGVQVSKAAGVNTSSLYNWENELPNRTPGIEKVRAVVNALHKLGACHPIHKSKQRGHLLEYLFYGE